MATKVRGITIEIGGDASKLEKSLKDVNQEIKTTSTSLKDVEKLLKLDPGNTELLRQKYNLLGDSISETKKKLETLQQAQKEMEQAVANGSATTAQYDALNREIESTKINLEKLTKEQEEFLKSQSKLQKMSEAFGEFGDKVEAAGEKMLTVTGAIAGLGTAAVKIAADFDQGMSKVQAISGATAEDMEKLTAKARDMGATTKFSATESAQALTYMAMAGWKTEDMLSGIEGVMNLAAASGEDLATVSDIVTDAMTAFGLEAKDSGRFADVLAKAASNANTNVSMMGETFKYVAPVAGAMDYSIEDVATAIGIMANSGIKASQAGTALRRIFTQMTGPIDLNAAAFGEIAISTTEMDGTMRPLADVLGDLREAFAKMTDQEKVANAENIAGKNALSGFLALVTAGESDVTKLATAISNSSGAAEEMAGVMLDNLSGQLTILKSGVQELAISFGELMMPAIRDITGGVQKLIDWLNNLDDDTKQTIVTVVEIVAAIGPLLIIIGKLTQALSLLFAHPIIAIIGGIAAAIVGIVIAIKNAKSATDEYTASVKAETNALKEKAGKIRENAEAYLEQSKAQKEGNKSLESQTGQIEALWERLQKITDENGNIKKGYEDQATVITTQLNEALGTTLLVVGDQIKGYQQVAAEIDNIIQKKRTEALLDANKDAYQQALQNETQLLNDMAEAQAMVNKEEEETARLAAEIERAKTDETWAFEHDIATKREFDKAMKELTEQYDLHNSALQDARAALATAADAYGEAQAAISNYENVVVAATKGGEELDAALSAMSSNLRTSANADKATLLRQLQDYKTTYEGMKTAVANGSKTISDEQLKRMEGLIQITQKELDKLSGVMKTSLSNSYANAYYSGTQMAKGLAAGISDHAYLPARAGGNMARRAKDQVNAVLGVSSPAKVMVETGKYIDQGMAKGMTDNLRVIEDAVRAITAPITGADMAMQASDQAAIAAEGLGGGRIVLHLTQPINLGGKTIGQAVTENVINRIDGQQELVAAYLGW